MSEMWSARSEPIAIVGVACRVPGADSPDRFWQRLRNGDELISFFSEDELAEAGVDPRLLRDPSYVRAKPCLPETEWFDADLFGVPPGEAELMDPQHRVFLELAFEALERAGLAPGRMQAKVGTYVSSNMSFYLSDILTPRAWAAPPSNPFHRVILNDKDYLAARLAYHLDLRGPAVTIQTACSSSLVAVVHACRALALGECDAALAGGISLFVPPRTGYLRLEGGLLSPDGHVRPYAAQAAGTVFGDGAGVVVLKREADALVDGDPIHARILGTAVNNDGSGRLGFSAPGLAGQADVISAAISASGVPAESIGFVEGHGSGTPLGDAIEVEALSRAFAAVAAGSATCGLGSVKGNVGHLYSAAGIVGLIKAVLAVERGQIPPSLHCEETHPQIDFAGSPFFVETALRDWPSDKRPRRAGVSSFGLGGTNAHVVIEQAPSRPQPESDRRFELMLLSARSEDGLERTTAALAEHLREDGGQGPASISRALAEGRRHFPHRRAFVVDTRSEQTSEIASGVVSGRLLTGRTRSRVPSVAFLLSGFGELRPGVGTALYDEQPVFRREMDACLEVLEEETGVDLRSLWRGETEGGAQAGRSLFRGGPAPAGMLDSTRLGQPLVFALDYALARLWIDWGVEPAVMLGHSIGEYAAATLAGVFELEDALRLVARRAALVERMPPGATLAVASGEEELRERLPASLAIAAVNGPALCLVSGAADEVARFAAELEREGLPGREVPASHAFHSPLLAPVATELAELVAAARPQEPQRTWISNLTGELIDPRDAVDPQYWSRHLCRTVRFADGIRRIHDLGHRILIEAGPGQALTSFALQQRVERGDPAIALPSLGSAFDTRDETRVLLESFARVWMAGVRLEPGVLHRDRRAPRAALPGHALERRRFWLEAQAPVPEPAVARKRDLSDWFHSPAWLRREPVGPDEDGDDGTGRRWLILRSPDPEHAGVVERLRERGRTVVEFLAGDAPRRISRDAFIVDPASRDGLGRALAQLHAEGSLPDVVVDLWCLEDPGTRAGLLERARRLGFHALLAFYQAWSDLDASAPCRLLVVTRGMQAVLGEDCRAPELALVLGPCRTLPLEQDAFSCRSVDFDPDAPAGEDLVPRLIREAGVAEPAAAVAYRRGARFTQGLAAQPVAPPPQSLLRDRGTYLVTGGFGAVGSALAGFLARRCNARLALLGRTELPDPAQWDAWLADRDPADPVSRRIRTVRALEEAGTEVLPLAADVANAKSVFEALRDVLARFGSIDGIIHAAGVPGAGLGALKRARAADEVLAPKVDGAVALLAGVEELGVDPDFVAFCSSELAVASLPGQIDYCAANAFLDALAASGRGSTRRVTVSVGWSAWEFDTWQEDGLAALPEVFDRVRRHRDALGIGAEEGGEALLRCLGSGFAHLVVSPVQIGVGQRLAESPASAADAPAAESYPRPELGVDYEAPRDATEQQLVALFEESLSLRPVGVQDNFLELGGHSLLATRILSRMRSELGWAVSMRQFFENPTVAGLAAVVSAGEASPSETIEPILPEDGEGLLAALRAVDVDGDPEEPAP